jgi:putative Mn2+ efflux pump MntP
MQWLHNNTRIGRNVGIGILICEIIGIIMGLLTHNVSYWMGYSIPVGSGLGVIINFFDNRRARRNA